MTAPSTVPGPAPASGRVKSISRFNRFMVRLMSSPLAGLAGGNVVLIRYKGHTSGLDRALPVNAWNYENGLLIRVGRPEQKSWWRNFRTAWPIEIVRRGRVTKGTGLAVDGGTERGRQIAADYFSTHRGAAKRAGLPRLPKRQRRTLEEVADAAKSMVFVVVTPEAAANPEK